MKSYRSAYGKRYCPNCDAVVAHAWLWRWCGDCWRMVAKTAVMGFATGWGAHAAERAIRAWWP